jgi:lysozyme
VHLVPSPSFLYFYVVPPQKTSIPRQKTPPKSNPVNTTPQRKTAPRKKKQKKKPLSVQFKFGILALMLILLSPFYYGYIIKGFSSTWRWITDWGADPHYRKYTSFQIRIPDKYNIHGIDVSYYQGKIDWKMVKSMKEDDVEVTFAIIKASEGIAYVDPYFQRNWREAAKAGIVCGAYHFFRPQKSGEWQGKFFLQTVSFEAGDLPPVVDIEQLNGVSEEEMRKELSAFLKYVEKKTGVKPIIYSGLTFYNDYLRGHFPDYPLWVAHYHKADLRINESANWLMWQHSDRARITGINHAVDFNAFRGDSLAFQRLLLK